MDAKDEERFNPAFKARQDAHRRARLEKQRKEIIADLSGEKLLDKPQRPQQKAVANIQPGQNRPQTSQPVRVVKPVPAATPPKAQRPVNRPVKPTLTKDVIRPVSQAERRDLGKAPAQPSGKQAAAPAVAPNARPMVVKPKGITPSPIITQLPRAFTPQGTDIDRLIQDQLVPWFDRPRGSSPWAGRLKANVNEDAQRLHDLIQSNTSANSFDNWIGQAQSTLGVDASAAKAFVNNAFDLSQRTNKLNDFGVPGNDAREGVWKGILDASGRPTDTLNHVGQVTATDLRTDTGSPRKSLIDVQDLPNPNSTRIGVLKNLGKYGSERGNGLVGQRAFNSASGSKKLIDIVKDLGTSLNIIGNDKLTQSSFGPMNSGPFDRNMGDELGVNRWGQPSGRRQLAPTFRKDFIVGGYWKNGLPNWNPSMFDKGYAVNLDTLRGNLLNATKEEIENSGITLSNRQNLLAFDIPMQELKALGDGEGATKHLVSDEVRDYLKRQGTDFYAGMGTQADADSLIKGAVKGRLGGLTNVALNGASREAGLKLGKGDYVGAAAEFGKDYAIGAAADVGLRKAGQAILQRMPGLATRVATGTAASGGWAAPIMGAYAVYDVADGLVEGVTGKGIRKREEEMADAAVTRAYERKWNQPAPKGGFVPKDKPLVQEKPQRAPMSLESINKAVEATKGIAPEAKAQPAQITQGTPQVDKPDTGNFLSQWTNKVRSWFK